MGKRYDIFKLVEENVIKAKILLNDGSVIITKIFNRNLLIVECFGFLKLESENLRFQ